MIWLCTDGAAGNINQARALAQGVADAPAKEIIVHANQLPRRVRWFAPRFSRLSRSELEQLALANTPAAGQIVIGCGRVSAIVLDALKRRDPSLRTLQILHPRCAFNRFDWVICPAHDQAHGANVLSLPGSLTAIDDSWLAAGRRLPAARDVRRLVLVGAPTRNAPFTARDVLAAIAQLPKEGLRISVSRRTPIALTHALQELQLPLWRGAIDGENPYQAWLSAAEEIWLTPDSVNMLSEACATHARLRVIGPECARGKIAQFLTSIAPRLANTTPFRPTQDIFATLRQALHIKE